MAQVRTWALPCAPLFSSLVSTKIMSLEMALPYRVFHINLGEGIYGRSLVSGSLNWTLAWTPSKYTQHSQ